MGLQGQKDCSVTTSQLGPVTDVTWLCRGSLLPDPRYDAVRAVFLAVMDDVEECPDGLYTARLLLFDDTGTAAKDAMNHVQACQQKKAPEIPYQYSCFLPFLSFPTCVSHSNPYHMAPFRAFASAVRSIEFIANAA